jgi:hypothetical protein
MDVRTARPNEEGERYSVGNHSSGNLKRTLISAARHFSMLTALFVFCASTATAMLGPRLRSHWHADLVADQRE